MWVPTTGAKRLCGLQAAEATRKPVIAAVAALAVIAPAPLLAAPPVAHAWTCADLVQQALIPNCQAMSPDSQQKLLNELATSDPTQLRAAGSQTAPSECAGITDPTQLAQCVRTVAIENQQDQQTGGQKVPCSYDITNGNTGQKTNYPLGCDPTLPNR